MYNNEVINELQKMNTNLNTKDSFTINGVVKSTEPYYNLPQPISLQSGRKYRAALIDFSSDNYFENINANPLNNNKFYYSINKGASWNVIEIPNGYYDIDEYNNEIMRQMIENGDYDKTKKDNDRFHLSFEVNLSTYRTILTIKHADYMVDFTKNDTFRKNLGFKSAKLGKGRHLSENRIQITHVKRINVHCDLVTGGYDNQGKKSDIILSYATGEFAPGQIVSVRPNTPIYLPVIRDAIDVVRFSVTDQLDNDLKTEGEEISFCFYVEQV